MVIGIKIHFLPYYCISSAQTVLEAVFFFDIEGILFHHYRRGIHDIVILRLCGDRNKNTFFALSLYSISSNGIRNYFPFLLIKEVFFTIFVEEYMIFFSSRKLDL